MRVLLWLWCAWWLVGTAQAEKRKVWIDTDIQFDKFGKDVDDGVALMMALQSDEIEVVGISLIHKVHHGYEVTQRLLDHYARYQIPVYKGTDDAAQSYGTRTEAVDALAAALAQAAAEGTPLTLLAIGPATNLANVLHFYPEAGGQIGEVIFCAGRTRDAVFRPAGSRKNLPDYNFEIDSLSFRRVLMGTDFPVTLAGYEAAADIYLQKADIRQIRRRGRPGDRWVARQLSNWRFAWRVALGVRGFIPFDTAALGHLLAPEQATYRHAVPLTIRVRANDSRFLIKADTKAYLEVATADEPILRRVSLITHFHPDYRAEVMRRLLGSGAGS